MADPALSGNPCPSCGLVLAPSLLACVQCGALVHASTLRELAGEAERAASENRIPDALGAWRRALPLLPPGTTQHAAVSAKIAALGETGKVPEALTNSTPEPVGTKRGWLAGLGALGLVLWKAKALVLLALSKGKLLLLGLTKLPTLLSMATYFATSWALWGWPFALGIVLSIYVHEMGHVWALRQLGIPASAPMFIPGLGAFVRLKANPANEVEDARTGLAGPIWGLAAALVALGIAYGTGLPVMRAIAGTGAWINLFNLMPVGSLDGGRGFRALDRGQRLWIAALLGVLFLIARDGLLLLVAGLAVFRALRNDGPAQGHAPTARTFMVVAAACALVAALAQGKLDLNALGQ